MDKLTVLDVREIVLKRLEEIKPEAGRITVELKQTPDGYSFELEQAA
jgi:hypothetical protein